MTKQTNRLETIAAAQRTSRIRDAVFALCLAVAAVVSLTSVSTGVAAASTQVAHR
jgi:hypothetical protein